MPNIDRFFDEIDESRARRAKELSEIKKRFGSNVGSDPMRLDAKVVVVLTYAHWEGFYNDCVEAYVSFLKARGGKIRDNDWMMLTGVFATEFESLKDKHHSHDARRAFIKRMKDTIEAGYEKFRSEVIEARSNLNFEKLSGNCSIMNFDVAPFQKHRVWIDKQLVKWRHEVAHGDLPDLSELDMANHIDRSATVLLLLADRFQEAMLERLPTQQ